MENTDRKEWLISQLTEMSKLLSQGKYEDIDLKSIEREAQDLAKNFQEFISSLQTVGSELGAESHDVSHIREKLRKIITTTENSVKKVIDFSEGIMNDVSEIRNRIQDLSIENSSANDVDTKLSKIQDSAFNIMTSLEFEDINRQMIEKINERLNLIYDNFMRVLIIMKLKDKLEQNDTKFMSEMTAITDPSVSIEEKQNMIDELFKEFGL